MIEMRLDDNWLRDLVSIVLFYHFGFENYFHSTNETSFSVKNKKHFPKVAFSEFLNKAEVIFFYWRSLRILCFFCWGRIKQIIGL